MGLGKFAETRPRAGRLWYKAHGLGNDYLVVEEGVGWELTAESVERVCDRTRGVGSDGVVVLLGGDEKPFRLRMFNPDGGEFERSGNGLRVLASHLHRTGRVVVGKPFEVEVGGDRVRMEVHGTTAAGVYDVSAEMGRASVEPDDAGLARGALDTGGRLDVPGVGRISLQTVSVGNPHAVVFTEEMTTDELRRLGPHLATHASFAAGTNVQLARVAGPGAVDALVWERGVGPTSASGTSACAVAVAAVYSGRLPPGEVEIRMEGGSLRVQVSGVLDVVLRGPVQEVTTGEMTDGFLEWLRMTETGRDSPG
jgi:diaminopimelate epimerase